MSGRAITRTSGIYALGSAIAVPVGIASLAITTRYLSVGEFGRLAGLFALASLLTFIANLGSLQGTLICVYGAAGEGGEDDEEIVIADELTTPAEHDGRRMLGSGVFITVLATGAVSAIALAFVEPIGNGLLRTEDLTAVRLAILAGATGAIWRLVQQVYRMERRPVAHSVLGTVRPFLVIGLTVYALTRGWGVRGVIGATALGTILASLLAVVSARRYYRLRPRLRDVVDIYRPGLAFAPIVIVSFARSHVDVLLLTQAASPREVGLYSVASRIAQIPIHISSAYLMAWAPLERSPIFRAAVARHGRSGFSGTLFTYLTLLNLVLLVALTLGADLLIRIAAPRFEPAAVFIPFAAAAFMAYTTFYALFRVCRFPRRRTVFVILSLLALGLYAALSVVLVPRFGAYAIAVTSMIASIGAISGMLVIDKRAGGTVDVPAGRLLGAVGLAAAIVVGAQFGRQLGTTASALLELGGIVLFPVLLVCLRIVRRERLADLRTIAGELVPWAMERESMLRRWPSLSAEEQDAINLLVRDGRPAAAAAKDRDVPEAVLHARLVRALRRLARIGAVTPVDHRVGKYLLSTDPNFERDREAHRLAAMGAAFEDLHQLELAYRSLRHLRRSRWRRLTRAEEGPVLRGELERSSGGPR